VILKRKTIIMKYRFLVRAALVITTPMVRVRRLMIS